ncbi:OmpL47-type beta-barrel domain-containing protein [Paenibacillus harenae]|uniref:OmpL47-type beta-barrel domain-containing protein n=1 Tax=Paenibacillus harenae TaxID=306543 RepID=UPI0003F75881|nr:pectinesterase [Paenibacillus harenae]
MKKRFALILCFVLGLSVFQMPIPAAHASYDALPAFPGAEGFGYAASGGRGGEVYRVTSYELTGPGTFHDALITAGSTPRTIVFDISGEITIPKIVVKGKSKITIAGQTAPGDGVTIRGNNIRFINSSDIVIRYLRFRMGVQNFNDDTMYFEDCQNVIIDHSSFSWGTDEVLSIKSKDYDHPESKNITVQWSVISEGLLTHSMGGLIEMNTITMHHNLYAHNNDRNPKTKGQIDFVNNIVYNWGGYPYVAGGESGTKGYGNVVGNYFVAGLNSASPEYAVVRGNENYSLYLANNRIDGNKNGILDGTDTGTEMMEAERPSLLVPERFEYPPVHTHEPETAYEHVLDYAGASLLRDKVDQRVIDSVRNQTGVIIGHENDVGGFPQLKQEKGPLDTDLDGMPDAWETARELNPDNPEDRNGDRNGDGYTNLEEYLNELAEPGFPSNYPTTPPAWTGSPFIPPVVPTPEPEFEPVPSMDGEAVRNVVINDDSGSGSVNAANWSAQKNLQPGDFVAGDRMTGSKAYTFVSIPDEMKGLEWIRSAVSSRSATSPDLLSFYLAADADVYVAHDSRITELPQWLASSYEDTGLIIADNQPVEFKLYKKHYSAGSHVVMGANNSTSKMNYFVILKPTSRETAPPAEAASGLTGQLADGPAVSLNWAPVSGVDAYLIYRSTSLDPYFKVIGSADSTTYTDSAAVMGVTYQYKISAVNAGGESPHSGPVEVLAYDPSKPVLSAPIGLQVTAAKSISVTLAWTPADDAVSYGIYRSAAADGPYAKIGSTSSASYTDKDVEPSMTYHYYVTATSVGGESASSGSVGATTKPPVPIPHVPAGLSAGTVATNVFEIEWNPVDHAESYHIYRKGNGDNDYTRIGSTTVPRYSDDSVGADRTGYSYKVTAENEMGESAPSEAIDIAMPLPAIPTNLFAGLVGESFVGLVWTSHGGATRYQVYRESAGEPVQFVGYAKVDTYYDRTVEPGVEYTYYIKALNASGESEPSNSISVRTLDSPKDVTPPVTKTDAEPGWHNTAQVINLSANDAEGSMTTTYYSVNDAPFKAGNQAILSEEGVHTLRYYSIDAVGNKEAVQSTTISIDFTGPAISPSITEKVYRPDAVSFPFAATDTLSGIDQVDATLDGEEVSLPVTAEPYALSIGEHTIVITAADHAGNVSVQQYVFEVIMDRGYLDEALRGAYDQGKISNQGILNSLLAKVTLIQNETDATKIVSALHALENEMSAQAGKQLDSDFALNLLADLVYLKEQASQ